MFHEIHPPVESGYKRSRLMAEAESHRRRKQLLAGTPGAGSRLMAAIVQIRRRFHRNQPGVVDAAPREERSRLPA